MNCGKLNMRRSFRRRVSIVWRYFEKLSRDKVKCRLCHHIQNYQGTTGNILRHLSRKHNIDATVKAQQDRNIIFNKVKNQLVVLDNESSQVENNKYKTAYLTTSKKPNLNPYEIKENLTKGYVQMNIIDDTQYNPDEDDAALTAEEECLLAEIQYYREKASYYRGQKNLVCLQVLKTQHELKQIHS